MWRDTYVMLLPKTGGEESNNVLQNSIGQAENISFSNTKVAAQVYF